MFVDMLGFAHLTKLNPHIDLKEFQYLDRKAKRGEAPLPHKTWTLAHHFHSFHETLEQEIEAFGPVAQREAMKYRFISFSDSAFISMPTLEDAVHRARALMRKFILAEVPVRIGIGYGTLTLLRFRSEWNAEVQVHTSQFLGSAVVHAHEAEQARVDDNHPRVPGLRIFLDESTRTMATISGLGPPDVLPIHVQSNPVPIGADYRPPWAEVNYTSSSDPGTDMALLAAIDRMKTTAPRRAKRHYDATTDAIHRMRGARNGAA